MARTWLSIRVDLVEGPGEHLWPRPGRILAAAGRHSFAQLADAIDDDWAHLCTVDSERVDPLEELGIVPVEPLPCFGWGDIPDQYRRRWDGDDGESRPPRDPGVADLPPLRQGWGKPDR